MTQKDIRAAIKTKLLTLNTNLGHAITAKAALTFSVMASKTLSKRGDQDYPKLFIVSESNKLTEGVSGTADSVCKYMIVCVHKPISNPAKTEEEVADIMEKVAADIAKLFVNDSTLGNRVHNCIVTDCTTDSGFTFPEGIAALELTVEQLQKPLDQII